MQDLARFDLCALLKVLEGEGYGLEKLLLQGNTVQSSYASLCSSLTVSEDAYFDLPATLTLNLGLLVGSSPLPNYYRQCMEKGVIDEESFLIFLQFFNHHVIKNFLKVSWAERFVATLQKESHLKRTITFSRALEVRKERAPLNHLRPLKEHWRDLQLANLMILGLDCVSSLHWAFSLCFPELELEVKKCIKKRKVYCADFILGMSQLGGKCALGGYFSHTIRAYSVALSSDIEQTDQGTFWPIEIRERLKELIFPLIEKTHIYLRLSFTINQYQRATYLNRLSRMGFASLGEATSNFTWRLYDGYGFSSD